MASQYYPNDRAKVNASYNTDINALVSAFLGRSQDISKKLISETTIGAMIINALIRFVIGPGLEPKASPETSILKWSTEERNKFIASAESFFRMYAGSKDIDYYNRESFGSLQSVALRNILTDGDTLLHRIYGSKEQSYKPMIQLLSGCWISNPVGTMDTKEQVGGVLFDARGRERGYCILQTDGNLLDSYTVKSVNKYNASGFEEFMLVGIQPRESNQVRGIPWLSSVSQDILDLEKFKIAHRTKAATQALLTAVIKSTEDAPSAPVSSVDKIRGLERKSEALPVEQDTSDVQLGAGNVVALNPGESIDMLESKAPMSSYKEFVELELSQIGGAVSVPYEMMTQRYNSSFSASRATIVGAEKTYKVIREEFADKMCAPVWEQVIDYGIRLGMIEAPGYLEGSELYKRAVLASTWIGPSSIVIDPTREINAHIQAISNNLEPREIATRELLQMDFEEVTDMLANEKEILEKKGLDVGAYDVFQESNPNTDTDNKEEQDNEE